MRKATIVTTGLVAAAAVLGALAPVALADGPKVGDTAENVELALSDGSKVKLHEIGKPVVLFFYPKDFTGG